MKVLFSSNILFSYPVTIFPTNTVIESFLFPHKDNTDEALSSTASLAIEPGPEPVEDDLQSVNS